MATQPAARHIGAAQMKAAMQAKVPQVVTGKRPAVPLPEMVLIPAGPFLIGEERRTVVLPDYYIAKTPITNAQYRLFVEASGRKPPQNWENQSIPDGKEKHPIVCVPKRRDGVL